MEYIQLALSYIWEILAFVIAPLIGFGATQFIKPLATPLKLKCNPCYKVVIIFAALGLTWYFAQKFWEAGHTPEMAYTIALAVALLQVLIVRVWFVVASKVAPEHAATLAGEGDSLTIIPGLKVSRKQ